MYYLITFKISTEALNQFISVFLSSSHADQMWVHFYDCIIKVMLLQPALISEMFQKNTSIHGARQNHLPASIVCRKKENKTSFLLESHDITSVSGVGTVAFNQNSLLMTSFLGRSSSSIPHEQYQDDFIHEESAFQTNRISICLLLSFSLWSNWFLASLIKVAKILQDEW